MSADTQAKAGEQPIYRGMTDIERLRMIGKGLSYEAKPTLAQARSAGASILRIADRTEAVMAALQELLAAERSLGAAVPGTFVWKTADQRHRAARAAAMEAMEATGVSA